MNILIPGGCGYVGAVLVPKLLADGHKITVYDTMWFGEGFLPDNPNVKVVKADVRDLDKFRYYCKNKDVLIYLASMSNNAMYGVNYKLTHEVNAECFMDVVITANKIPRFIYASSVAVEDPTSNYAKDKLHCESLLNKNDALIVRASSVCGYSPHQRLDLTINKMVHDAFRKGVITIHGGEQQRCHIHIHDLCDFYKILVNSSVVGKTFNVSRENLSVKYVAEMVQTVFRDKLGYFDKPREVKIEVKERTDDRSYTTDISKTTQFGFRATRSLDEAMRELVLKFDAGYWKDSLTNPLYQNMI